MIKNVPNHQPVVDGTSGLPPMRHVEPIVIPPLPARNLWGLVAKCSRSVMSDLVDDQGPGQAKPQTYIDLYVLYVLWWREGLPRSSN